MDAFDSFDWSGITYPTAYMHRLFDFARERNPKRILEVGFDQGASALAFLRACPQAEVLSIDIASCEVGADRVQRNVPDWKERHVFMHGVDSRKFLPVMVADKHEFDLIFIDGDHLYDAVKDDIENGAKLLAPGGCMILDDADPNHTHFGVYRAAMEFLAANAGFVAQPLEGSPSYQLIIQRV